MRAANERGTNATQQHPFPPGARTPDENNGNKVSARHAEPHASVLLPTLAAPDPPPAPLPLVGVINVSPEPPPRPSHSNDGSNMNHSTSSPPSAPSLVRGDSAASGTPPNNTFCSNKKSRECAAS